MVTAVRRRPHLAGSTSKAPVRRPPHLVSGRMCSKLSEAESESGCKRPFESDDVTIAITLHARAGYAASSCPAPTTMTMACAPS